MAESNPGFWLVVEDDDNDFLLFRRACSFALNPPPTIHRETDGIRAENFLTCNSEKPELVISDLKMPQMNGLELLDWLRHQPNLERLRFVMLSSSNLDGDVQAARQLGADDYRVKPSELRQFVQVIKELSHFAE
jgi:CheY-like chemotaxis protein